MTIKTLTPEQWLEYYQKHPRDFELFIKEVETQTREQIDLEQKYAALKNAARKYMNVYKKFDDFDNLTFTEADEAYNDLADLLTEQA